MNMKKIGTLLIYILLINLSFGQNKNILDCLKTIDFKLEDFNESDFFKPTDTIIDIKNGYYELFVANTHIIDNIEQNTVLCQAAKFNNTDGTIILAITGYYGDEQCSKHPSFFFEISKNGDDFKRIELSNILPNIELDEFLSESKAIKIIEEYLPKIQGNYLDTNATVKDVLNEIYDIHYILPRKGKTITATLTVCDYIPTNEVSFEENDWEFIEREFKTIDLVYNDKLKTFKKTK